MKLVSYKTEDQEHLGVFYNGHIYNLNSLNHVIPDNMQQFLEGGDALMEAALRVFDELKNHKITPKEELFFEILAPVPHPTSCRDAYAFRQHVATARLNRNAEMIPEFDQFPVFYFTNHNSIYGTGVVPCMPDHFDKLDFELEIAVVLNKKGRNIKAADADEYIAGYMIMNDLSARTLQLEEMRLNLGPAKGKDFATVLGPWLVTKDEIQNPHRLRLWLSLNGKMMQDSNTDDLIFNIPQLISYSSQFMTLLPGDVISTGTPAGVGLGFSPNIYLKPGDVVELGIDGLGSSKQTAIAYQK